MSRNFTPTYHLAEGEYFVECPYNKSHQIESARMTQHLVKCRKQYDKDSKNKQIGICRYNYKHRINKPELAYHETHCPNAHSVIPFIEEQKKAAQHPEPSAQSHLKIDPELDENWDDMETEDKPWYDPKVKLQSEIVMYFPREEKLTKAERKKLRADNNKKARDILEMEDQKVKMGKLRIDPGAQCGHDYEMDMANASSSSSRPPPGSTFEFDFPPPGTIKREKEDSDEYENDHHHHHHHRNGYAAAAASSQSATSSSKALKAKDTANIKKEVKSEPEKAEREPKAGYSGGGASISSSSSTSGYSYSSSGVSSWSNIVKGNKKAKVEAQAPPKPTKGNEEDFGDEYWANM